MFNIKTILLITFLVPFGLYAQDISDVIDPSIINELSDDEIALIKNQINNQQIQILNHLKTPVILSQLLKTKIMLNTL